MPLLLDVWREACRHIDAGESVDRIAPLLSSRLNVDLLILRKLDVERMRVETIAAGTCGGAGLPERARNDVTHARIAEVLTWWRSGRMTTGRVDEGLLSVIVPPGLSGCAIAAALPSETGETYGILVLVSLGGGPFGEKDLAVAEQLLEPLGVALANDERLKELGRLREAVEADNRALLTRLERDDLTDTIIGASAGLRGVLDRVKQVAPTDAPVLILGETGTGKEVIARAVHAHSSRARGPVERVNCGALASGLIDSELFGHERGSFTGAVSQRKGWFERADGGTLLLDEVAELPLDAQVRLLRILQDGTYERVGGSHTRTVDVRIVAATHRDLHAMVGDRTFREDLWYRIGVFPIRLPPLRERREDIPTLAAHFASRAGRRLGGVPLVPGAADVDMLLAYPWPGNVRELASVIERAVILGDGHRLELSAAFGGAVLRPSQIQPQNDAVMRARELPHDRATHARQLPQDAHGHPRVASLDDAMRDHIHRALLHTRGRIEGPGGAATLLRINPHTLRARMRKLGMQRANYVGVEGLS